MVDASKDPDEAIAWRNSWSWTNSPAGESRTCKSEDPHANSAGLWLLKRKNSDRACRLLAAFCDRSVSHHCPYPDPLASTVVVSKPRVSAKAGMTGKMPQNGVRANGGCRLRACQLIGGCRLSAEEYCLFWPDSSLRWRVVRTVTRLSRQLAHRPEGTRCRPGHLRKTLVTWPVCLVHP